jgi:hypothetical protein
LTCCSTLGPTPTQSSRMLPTTTARALPGPSMAGTPRWAVLRAVHAWLGAHRLEQCVVPLELCSRCGLHEPVPRCWRHSASRRAAAVGSLSMALLLHGLAALNLLHVHAPVLSCQVLCVSAVVQDCTTDYASICEVPKEAFSCAPSPPPAPPPLSLNPCRHKPGACSTAQACMFKAAGDIKF